MGDVTYRYRLKIAPRQRPNYEGVWIEVETARPAPANFSNATKFFAPFHRTSDFIVAIERAAAAQGIKDEEITRLREENAGLSSEATLLWELLDDVFAQWDGDWPEELVARVKAAISNKGGHPDKS